MEAKSMSAGNGKFTRCPVCRSEVEAAAGGCKVCGCGELGDADFLDESGLADYQQRVATHRVAWTALEDSLRTQLRRFGLDWGRLENWKQIWTRVQPDAAKLNLGELSVSRHAKDLWEKITAEPPPPPPEDE